MLPVVKYLFIVLWSETPVQTAAACDFHVLLELEAAIIIVAADAFKGTKNTVPNATPRTTVRDIAFDNQLFNLFVPFILRCVELQKNLVDNFAVCVNDCCYINTVLSLTIKCYLINPTKEGYIIVQR